MTSKYKFTGNKTLKAKYRGGTISTASILANYTTQNKEKDHAPVHDTSITGTYSYRDITAVFKNGDYVLNIKDVSNTIYRYSPCKIKSVDKHEATITYNSQPSKNSIIGTTSFNNLLLLTESQYLARLSLDLAENTIVIDKKTGKNGYIQSNNGDDYKLVFDLPGMMGGTLLTATTIFASVAGTGTTTPTTPAPVADIINVKKNEFYDKYNVKFLKDDLTMNEKGDQEKYTNIPNTFLSNKLDFCPNYEKKSNIYWIGKSEVVPIYTEGTYERDDKKRAKLYFKESEIKHPQPVVVNTSQKIKHPVVVNTSQKIKHPVVVNTSQKIKHPEPVVVNTSQIASIQAKIKGLPDTERVKFANITTELGKPLNKLTLTNLNNQTGKILQELEL